MKIRYTNILIFLSLIIVLSSAIAKAQKSEKEPKVKIESVVKDEKGNPIAGAQIYGNEGTVLVKTDDAGKFRIDVPSFTDLLIEADGFEPTVFKSGEYENLKNFTIQSSRFMYGEKDVVNIAFGKTKKGDVVNAIGVINPDEILKFDNIQGITEALNGRVPGLLYGSNIRGLGTAMYIVDGLPRDISTINLSEVGQITVLKDINSAMLYGNGAVNGVIQITTKRGQAYKNKVNVSGYYGISVPTALPKYLPSADYMELYNEAKQNDGLPVPYDAATIANYRFGNKYRYPNVDYYSDEYLKSFKPFSRVMTELSGGNGVATYYTNIGWDRSGSLLDFGAGESAKQSKFNIRGNVDIKINSWIKSSLDAVAVINNNIGAVGTSYWASASTMQPNLFAPLIPISLTNPNDMMVKGRKNDVNGMYLLGGTSSYLTNPMADGYSGGQNQNIQRTFSFNNRVDFDLKGLMTGLAFHTNVSFDFYTRYDQSINNTYSVYQPSWSPSKDSISSLTKFGTDTRPGTQNIGNTYYERRIGFYGLFDYDRTFGGIHHLTGLLSGFGTVYKLQGDPQGNKNFNLGLKLAYSYKNRFLADFSSALVNSVKLPPENRLAFSPSLGLAWVISSEEFMSSVSFINYLKLRASAGLMNSDSGIDGFYYWENKTGSSGSFSWYEGAWSNSGTVSVQGENPGLAFEKRKEINLGISGSFFNNQLAMDANFFKSVYYDQITRPQTLFPSFYTTYIPYQNFDSNSYHGVEIGLSYSKRFGDFSLVIGGNAMYTNSEVLKKDEVYADLYQYRKGHPIDARFGLVADGFFKDQNDINIHEIQAFGTVKPGDIKYVDQNKDGIIDANDEVQIGRWQAPYSYGLNLRLSYKNFSLFAKGNGSVGSDGYISDNYYWVDGNDKYSEYILNRWTPATATTATLPRLSSLANTNNYRSSSFWLYKDNYFTVDRLQLTYQMSDNIAKSLKMKTLSLFANGSNLLTISKFKDIRELRVGGAEPYYRSFSVGVKTTF